jgi:hypothetical protein
MKGVFEVGVVSGCKDVLAEQYHFAQTKLSVAQQCVGDWIIHHEARVYGGRIAYPAAALVEPIYPGNAIWLGLDEALQQARRPCPRPRWNTRHRERFDELSQG